MRTDQQPIRIALFAPDGRMGKAIQAAIDDDPTFLLSNDNGDVLIDFSAPDALQASLDRAASAGIPILVGTTGLDELADQRLAKAAESIAVLRAPNTSLGVALLADLVERAAAVLGPQLWDIEIVEAHHRKKADAPSGTAGRTAARKGTWTDPNFSEAFAHVEIEYRKAGDPADRVRVHRHFGWNLGDGELAKHPQLIRHLEQKGKVTVLVKGAVRRESRTSPSRSLTSSSARAASAI